MTEPYDELPADGVVPLEEAIAYKQRTAHSDAKVWRWMGNAADKDAASRLANQEPRQRAGEVMFNCNPDLSIAVWLFY